MNSRIKKIILWAVGIIFGAFVLLVIYRIPHVLKQQKTDEVVVKIHATKLTLDDVTGKNLPLDPGPDADKTIEGIDSNQNGIRDDAELAIFKKYPNSAKTRSAALQYALILQITLTQVFNSETLVAVMQEEGRASGCLYDLGGGINIAIQREENLLEQFILNTDTRKKHYSDIYEKYMTSFAATDGKQDCDIDPTALSN